MDWKKIFEKNIESEKKSLNKVWFFNLDNPAFLELKNDEVDLIIEEYARRGWDVVEFAKESVKKNLEQWREITLLKKKHEQSDKVISSLLSQVKALKLNDDFVKQLEFVNLDEKSIESKEVFIKWLYRRIRDYQKNQMVNYIKYYLKNFEHDSDYIDYNISLINSQKNENDAFKLLTELYKNLKNKEDNTFFWKIKKTVWKLLQ